MKVIVPPVVKMRVIDTKQVVDFITETRQEAGLAKTTLSKAVGMAGSYLGQIENSHREPSLQSMFLLLNTLGIDMYLVRRPFHVVRCKCGRKILHEGNCKFPGDRKR